MVGICWKIPTHFVGGSWESICLILFKKKLKISSRSMHVDLERAYFSSAGTERSLVYTIWDSTLCISFGHFGQLFLSMCEWILVLVISLETKGGISVASACIPVVNGISIITSLWLGSPSLNGTAPSCLGQTSAPNSTSASMQGQATL